MKKYNKKIMASSVYDYPVEDIYWDWSEEDLWQLRQEITLNSLYTNDFENSSGVIPRNCQIFFDGYFEELAYMAEQDHGEDADIFDYIDEYDNSDNLYNYWYGMEYPMLNPIEKMIENYCPKIGLEYDGESIYLESNAACSEYVDFDAMKYDDWVGIVKSFRWDSDQISKGNYDGVVNYDYELGTDYTEGEAIEFGEALKKLADYIEAIIG